MFTRVLAVSLIFVLSTSTVWAATVGGAIRLATLSTSFVPGVPFEAEVTMPPTSNLGSYNIDLVLTSESGEAGSDFFFDVDSTGPAGTGYVFSSAANFFDSVTVDSPSRLRITLSDFDFSGVNVASDINDRVANVFIGTTSTFSGDLQLFIDTDGLLLDTPDITPTPVAEYDDIRTESAAQTPMVLKVVPEPSSLAIAFLATCLWLCLHSSR